MNGTDDFGEDGASLFDIWEKLKGGWRHVVGGAVIGGLLAGTLAAGIQPSYQANATLQTGKVAGALIEDVTTMAERLKSPSLLLEVAKVVGDQQWVDQIENGGGLQLLTVQKKAPSPTTESKMIEVRVRARSPEHAKKITEVATAKVIERQDKLATPVLKKIRFELLVAKEKLSKAEQDLAALSKVIASTVVRDERFSQVSLLTTTKMQKESEIFFLRQTVFSTENSLLPPLTEPAKIFESVYVSRNSVSPKKGVVFALGLFGGLLAGVVSVFISSAWRQARERRSLAESGKARN